MNSRLLLIAATAIATAGSFVGAPYPNQIVLQHIPTAIGLSALAWVTKRYRVSPLSFACCLVFLWLHILGARWIYSFVPYDEWTKALFGQSLSEVFGWQRNHYDRLVHFGSGLLGVPPITEFLTTYCRTKRVASVGLSIVCVLALGAVYEVFEWQIAVVLSPATAESYNGQQGDLWDPQKDLALAWLGATIAGGMAARLLPAHDLGS